MRQEKDEEEGGVAEGKEEAEATSRSSRSNAAVVGCIATRARAHKSVKEAL